MDSDESLNALHFHHDLVLNDEVGAMFPNQMSLVEHWDSSLSDESHLNASGPLCVAIIGSR